MNWEAIGAIAELLGAAGVIVSLGYLASQIRQNTRTARAATFQAAAELRAHQGAAQEELERARALYVELGAGGHAEQLAPELAQ